MTGVKLFCDIAARGFCRGAGETAEGMVCVEQAVSLALGEPMSDSPDGQTLCLPAAYGRILNDACGWSSQEARAQALTPFGVAQVEAVLNGKRLDERRFVRQLALRTVRELLPPVLEAVGLGEAAEVCRKVTTLNAAYAAANSAAAYAYTATYAAAASAAAYAAYAARSAGHAANSAASAAAAADAAAANAADTYADYAAYAANYAANSATSAATSAANSVAANSVAAAAVRSAAHAANSAAAEPILKHAARLVTECFQASLID